ncbi:MAG: molecular chaperone HtpG [Prevotellaceae bacterium]|jgi:molecular chaperone HtpG|nr:molecular chaperone HtpG [Prevotellaceae bacterium]
MKGKIGVTTENIFPIIKKFLYSDNEIFLRELISNAVDASQKLKVIASTGEFKGETDDLKIDVRIDKNEKTITVSDRGIGMTADEIEKYINRIAFSGAEEFLTKYKDQANGIIGHFGLGFYSSFMVADKVEIFSKSWNDSAAVHWSCDGSPEYTLEESDKTQRGTDIVLHISADCEEFLETSRIEKLLNKYCKFLPVPIAFGKEQEWKDNKYADTDKDRIINDTNPLWMRKPSELTDDDYKKFYQTLYPMSDEPLFYIHLNVDYPFNLTGILYFPKIKSNIDINRNRIQLYCNQVFVSDSVEGVVPDFLTLLQGVIDSPDIPLNVSRSYLQSDASVKKISGHISKKVADRLNDIFKNNRQQFEEKWDDLKLFIEYGMISDEKFYERAEKFALMRDTDDKYLTFEEYRTLIENNQKDKNGTLIYLYATDKDAQYTFIDNAKNKGYNVLLMDCQLDSHYISKLEQQFKDSRFVRVDSDSIDNLIAKDEKRKSSLTGEQENDLKKVFEVNLPDNDKENFVITFEPLSETDMPVMITQNEFMRRMKDMSAMSGGLNFYGKMPDSYNFVINSNHAIINSINSEKSITLDEKLNPLNNEIKQLSEQKDKLDADSKNKKEEEISQSVKDEINTIEQKIDSANQSKNDLLSSFGKNNDKVKQLIDIALLSNNKLKGEALALFVKRSVELLKNKKML